MSKKGFSLIELLIYIAIFAGSSVFLVSIFLVFTRIHTHQSSLNEVNSQISFVNDTISRLVRESSVIDMTAGQATSTLKLRMASSSRDSTLIYLEDNRILLKEGSSDPIALTTDPVSVDDFSVTKYENPGGYSFVRFSVSMHYSELSLIHI